MFSVKWLLALYFCSCVQYTVGLGINFWKIKHKLNEEQKKHAVNHKLEREHLLPDSLKYVEAEEKFITQSLDHFDPQNQATYQQRYWMNDLYWKKPDGPIFIYIGGEGALSSMYVQWGAYVNFAERYGALIFAVEHRFYGASVNDDGLQLNNLRFLSSQQALADLAWFHKVMSDTYNLTEQNKWISFGGSYPGSLSAWFRVKYPHLVHASVASSAPVEAVVDFTGYNDVVTNSLNQTLIGGSVECLTAVEEAFNIVDIMLSNASRRSQLQGDFNLCSAISTDLDSFTFVSGLSEIFMGAVQYNSQTSLNVRQLCLSMLMPGTAYQNLVKVHKRFQESNAANCSDYSWTGFLSSVLNTTVAGNSGMRQWLYQTCSQFGYYQTCEVNTSCPFSKAMGIGPNLQVCRSAFDFKVDDVYRNVDFTNSYYGSIAPQGSRIFFVNGLVDPWHALSVLHNITSSELSLVIPGTSHCADMTPDQLTDPPALRAARQGISDQIGVWLADGIRDVNKPIDRTPRLMGSFQFSSKQFGFRQHL